MIELENQSALLEYIAENGYIDREEKVTVSGVSYRYRCLRCEWCRKPTLKREDSLSTSNRAFCSRWCEGRQKSSDNPTNPLGEVNRPPKWWKIREVVLERDNQRCQYCGRPRGLLERRPKIVQVGLTDKLQPDALVCLCPMCSEKNSTDNSVSVQAFTDGPFDIEFEEILCPHETCEPSDSGSWFQNRGDMHRHHALSHGKSLVGDDKECQKCGDIFRYYPEHASQSIHCSDCKSSLRTGEETECPDCGDSYLSLGMHWSVGSCSYPEMSRETKDILRGMLMGDAYIQKSSYDSLNHAAIEWKMSNEEFVEWLDDKLGVFARGSYSLCRTKAEAAQTAKDAGIVKNPTPSDYKRAYRNGTPRHPAFDEFEDIWITEEGNKQFPLLSMDLTPTVVRCWYVCDGGLDLGNKTPRARISSVNEVERFGELADALEEAVGVRPSQQPDNHRLQFDTEESRAFFEYVGWDPLPGFDYKWPDRDEYN